MEYKSGKEERARPSDLKGQDYDDRETFLDVCNNDQGKLTLNGLHGCRY